METAQPLLLFSTSSNSSFCQEGLTEKLLKAAKMFVDHFPAPFARSFDLVFRTVLAKLSSLKNLSKSLNFRKKQLYFVSKLKNGHFLSKNSNGTFLLIFKHCALLTSTATAASQCFLLRCACPSSSCTLVAGEINFRQDVVWTFILKSQLIDKKKERRMEKEG